jgi:hypothetical protein
MAFRHEDRDAWAEKGKKAIAKNTEYNFESLREEDDDTETDLAESSSLGDLDNAGQRSKARKQAYTKLLMKQLSLNQDDAEELIDHKGVDYFIEKFGTPTTTDDMEDELDEIKKSLSGVKGYRGKTSLDRDKGLAKELNEY